MAREIVHQLFEKSSNDKKSTGEDFKCSLKDWKDMLSRMDQMQRQIQFYGERTDTLYSKVINWMNRIKDKVEKLSKAHQTVTTATQQLEGTFQQQKQEITEQIQFKHKKTMDKLQNYGRLIRNYEESLNNVKHSLSQSKHQMLQLLGEINLLHMEMSDKTKRQRNKNFEESEITP